MDDGIGGALGEGSLELDPIRDLEFRANGTDLAALRLEEWHQVPPDESGSPCDEYAHDGGAWQTPAAVAIGPAG